MDWPKSLMLLAGFLAVVLLLEGVFLVWHDTSSPDVRRLDRRLRALHAGGQGEALSPLLRARPGEGEGALARWLLRLPRVASLERRLQQAGVVMPTSRFLMMSALFSVAVVLVSLVLLIPLPIALSMGAGGLLVPFAGLSWVRRKRLERLENQLPDAVDLIARALRAGHAFAPALQMVAEELPEPIASEFGATFDEINYGVSVADAMLNLGVRVPIDDLRFFSVAVILQRETGGNLAEILDNIGRLIRERFKLLGTVRVLSAEGRLSAWILTLLPIATALVIHLMSPDFMALLWKDPFGLQLVFYALAAMAAGIFWMWRIVQIRV